MKLRDLIITACFSFLWAYPAGADQRNITFIGESPKLFNSSSKYNDNYKLILSPPIYEDQDTEEYTIGFRVEDVLELKGHYERSVYDFSKKQSAVNVIEQVKHSLIASGFSVQYSCDGSECGEPVGWKTIYSKNIVESAENQFYMALKKENINSHIDEFVSVYVVDIDRRPRLIIDTLIGAESHRFDVFINTRDYARTIEKDGRVFIEGIYFESDSYKLSEGDSTAIEMISKIILEGPSDSKYVIVGHTDNIGDFDYNILLSTRRAEAVVEVLTAKFNVRKDYISAYGIGTLAPAVTNKTDEARKINRRIELIKL